MCLILKNESFVDRGFEAISRDRNIIVNNIANYIAEDVIRWYIYKSL